MTEYNERVQITLVIKESLKPYPPQEVTFQTTEQPDQSCKRNQILGPMAPSSKGGEPPSYKEVTTQFIQPSSSKICIHSNRLKATAQLATQQQTSNIVEKNPLDKGKKTINTEQRDPGNANQKTSSTCLPKSAEIPKYEIQPGSLEEKILFMKDHAIIDKLIGTWPNEKDLVTWIKQWCKPKVDVDLQLRSKGFLTTIFHSLKDKARIFNNGPYFYGARRLHMRYWIENFNLDKEDFTCVLVWIWLYSLP